MAFTATDLDTLDRAIAAGELSVRVNDRMVTYRSISELLAARSMIANAVASTAARAYPRHQLASFADAGQV